MSSPFANLNDPTPEPSQPPPQARRRKPINRLFVGGWVVAGALALLFGGAALTIHFWPAPAIRLTSVEVAERYSKDEFAADRDLTGKVVEITGRVASSFKDMIIVETPRPRDSQPTTLPDEPAGPESLEDSWNRMARASMRATAPHVAPASPPSPILDILCNMKAGARSGPKSGTVTIRGVCQGRDAPKHLVLENCDIISP